MILRRLAAAFRRQDWPTVGLEIMIVVLGVFLGLQVNNWTVNRSDRAAEIEHLAALEQDIQFSIDSLEDIIDRMEDQQTQRAELYRYSIDPDAEMDGAELAFLLYRGLYQGAPLRMNLTTFDSLKSSGRLGLLKSNDLVSRLQALSERIDAEYRVNADELQIMTLYSDRMLVENFPLGELFRRQTSFGDPMVPWLDEIRTEEDAPAFAKSIEFGNIVLYRSAFTQQRLRGSQELLSLCRDIQLLISERQAGLGASG